MEAGDPAGALDVLIDLVHLGRMMANREFYQEVAWGYRTMIDATIRIRDVVYLDYSASQPALTHEQLTAALFEED